MTDPARKAAATNRLIRDDELPFSSSVYEARLATVQRDLAERGLAGGLLFDPENLFWLTGYQTIGYFTFQTMFVPRTGSPTVVSRVVNREMALALSTIGDFEPIDDTADPVAVVAAFLARHCPPGNRIGVETAARSLTVADHRRLDGLVPGQLEDWNGAIEPHRILKSADELARIRAACRAAEAGLDAAIATVAAGRTENDVAAAMFQANIAAGSEYLGHPPLVVAGARTGLCFAMWRRNEIKAGDVVLLEAAGCVDRYHGIIARSVVVGPPSARQQRVADAIITVLETAIDTIKPGITAGEVDEACRRIAVERGYGDHFNHRTAYGIGIGFPPNWSEGHIYSIRPDDPLVLQPDMTFHIVPTVFLDDFGMCFSESVRVTETGCEVLTDYPRRLLVAET
jgi:Xaa-Pro dipeptidase